MSLPEKEVWYMWKEYCPPERPGVFDNTCLMTPRADPHEYEFAIDFIFKTEEEAVSFLTDWEIEPEEYINWVLCKETIEPVKWGKKDGV